MGLQIQSNAETAEELGLGHFRSPLAKSAWVLKNSRTDSIFSHLGLVLSPFGSVIDKIIIPSTTGLMSVLPGHASIIAVLKSGVLSVHEGNEVIKYFISSGFALIHTNSYAEIIAVEAKAEAQIGVDVHVALNSALTGKC
ncbi:hypothetical protein CUMW_182870 [Citrus unshiu]|uniref:ATP synthase F1 complex delta/epsilon subunit N-terminal domain-containing protein n=1 Tax=Citrus unshiu TaxID=55188 RepID=A0A2H5PZX2_CITUN|nr:hypothetical protein CUMW_182870 [Citrus unshiu]